MNDVMRGLGEIVVIITGIGLVICIFYSGLMASINNDLLEEIKKRLDDKEGEKK